MAEPITTTTTTTTYTAGDAVNLTHEAAIALGGYRTVEGIVEFVVTDTPPDPERGPLYHIRITTEGVPGHFGMGITRNYADEMQPATVAPPYDGEQLGIFVFNLHNSHLWVCPSSYDDPELCEGRAVSLTKAFGVEFLGTPLVRSHGMFEWYPATGASNTAALRRIVARGMARAAALRGPEGEVRP